MATSLSGMVEEAIDRYRQHIAGLPAFEGDEDAWTVADREDVSMEDHVIEALQCLVDVAASQGA